MKEDLWRNTLSYILHGRDLEATEKWKQHMVDIQQDMSAMVNNFILRRVNMLNVHHLLNLGNITVPVLM